MLRPVLRAVHIVDFVCFMVGTVLMQLRLQGEKMKKICAKAWKMVKNKRVSA